jgi:predicted MFS family arabinose efflux permease
MKFTRYQTFVAAMLAILQFAVILDFMIMSPLGAVIMPALHISPRQFGLVVSAYAFSAGISGLLSAGFADRFDRKKLLLVFYAGFLAGTFWCGLANTFQTLVMARVVTGIFGGVLGSVVLAIATDIYPIHLRGRVMGIIQTAFASSQVLGLPVGLYLSNRWTWHTPFLALAALGLVGGLIISWRMRPVTEHLAAGQQHGALMHLFHTIAEPRHLIAFAATALLTTGGFMIMPFSSAFTVNNMGIPLSSLPTIYLVTGICTIFIGPIIGKATDRFGNMPVLFMGSTLSIIMVVIYTHLGTVSLSTVILVNVIMFAGIFSRMIPFQVLMTAVPAATQRGSFNAVNAAVQSLAGGVASLIAGHIVSFGPDGKLQSFPIVGYMFVGSALIATTLAWRVNEIVKQRAAVALP